MPLDQQNFQPDTQIRELPDLPSTLIRTALADLERVEESPLYSVSMGDWHYYFKVKYQEEYDKCVVCFAGGVMAFSLGADRKCDLEPRNFKEPDKSKFFALDNFRRGDVEGAFHNLNLVKPPFRYRNVESYNSDPHQFKQDMARMADNLETAGF